MMELATMFEAKAVARPLIRDHLPIALVHHHPYSFDAAAETPLQKGLRAIGLDEEGFVADG